MKKVVYIPCKLNNDRVPGKNIRPFTNGLPLCQYVFDTLSICVEKNILNEVYCFCSSPEIQDYFPKNSQIKFLQRDKSLDQSTTLINEVTKSFVNKIEADIYVMAHVTCPFTREETIKLAIDFVEQGNFDSALPVKKIQNFLFDKSFKTLNFSTYSRPRTQDLEPLFEPTSGFFVFNKNVAKSGREIGDNPKLIEVAPLEQIDIDYPEDFEFANIVFNGLQTLRIK